MRTIILMGVLALPTAAIACTCAGPEGPEDALARADYVFRGRVTSANECGLPWEQPHFCHELDVTRVWKGRVRSTEQVGTQLSTCGAFMEVGVEYLVFARSWRSSEARLTTHWTSMCSGTAPISRAGVEFAFLGPGAAPVSPPMAPARGVAAVVLVVVVSFALRRVWRALASRHPS